MSGNNELFFRNVFVILFLLVATVSHAEDRGWDLYLTDPSAGTSRSQPKKALIKALASVKNSLYAAVYDISDNDIAESIISAKKRGVDVRIVTDRGNIGRKSVTAMIDAGIPVVTNDHRGLMHNKFAVLDGESVWTGSYNFTPNCSYKNNNNAVLVRSKGLADIYSAKFRDMFEHRIFGKKSSSGPFSNLAEKYYVKTDAMDINVHFSPGNRVERIITGRIEKAKKSIHFMAFSFTSDPIGEAMIKKFKSGVKVYGIFEKKDAKKNECEYHKMKLEGMPVRLDKNRGLLHHKVIIIDEELVITGSYNFSKNADRQNDENIIIIKNRDMARLYLQEFNRLY